MNAIKVTNRYVAFLRGINVGGHHKVPMSEFIKVLKKLGFKNIVTLLNSGNMLFDANSDDIEKLENTIAIHLEKSFGFPIPTIIRKFETICKLANDDPFKDIKINKDIRLYVSFLKRSVKIELKLPWESMDNSFKTIYKTDNTILSVLDLSISKTPKAMTALEQHFGSDITTRNWNTIKRIEKKL